MRDKNLLTQRNQKIKERYSHHYSKLYKGKRIHSYEYILHLLEEEFSLKSSTISKIINQ